MTKIIYTHAHISQLYNNSGIYIRNMLKCSKNFALSRKWVILDLGKSRMHVANTRIATEIPTKVYITSMLTDGDMKDVR